MIEAKGTREEVKQFSKELTKEIGEIWGNIENGFVDFDDALFIVFERRGWITNPEWKQAYDKYLLEYESNPDKEKVILKSFDIVKTMHDRIVELEKIAREGK